MLFTDHAVDRLSQEVSVLVATSRLLDEMQQHPSEP